MTAPALVLVAHGTRDRRGQETVLSLLGQVAAQLPGVPVLDAYVDVQRPRLDDVVASLVSRGSPVVVVPALLSTGYHVEVDIARAVATSPLVSAAAPLGPHPLLAEVLQDRLDEAGVAIDSPVVLAAAGSSRPGAAPAVRAVAAELAKLRRGVVDVGFASAATPSVADAVAVAAAGGVDPVIASYLLGHGFFHTALQRQPRPVTEPLGADPRIADLIVSRYAEQTRTPAGRALLPDRPVSLSLC